MLDLWFLIVISGLQFTMRNGVFSGFFFVNLVTPWLIFICVDQQFVRALVLTIIGAIILETHSALPAGVYICCYWITSSLVMLLRDSLSWRYPVTWLMTFLLSELWIIIFETLVSIIDMDFGILTLSFFVTNIVRIILTVGFGMFIFWRRQQLVEIKDA